jgi:hypothetical protein
MPEELEVTINQLHPIQELYDAICIMKWNSYPEGSQGASRPHIAQH